MAIVRSRAECTAECIVVKVPHERGSVPILEIKNGAVETVFVHSVSMKKRLVAIQTGKDSPRLEETRVATTSAISTSLRPLSNRNPHLSIPPIPPIDRQCVSGTRQAALYTLCFRGHSGVSSGGGGQRPTGS